MTRKSFLTHLATITGIAALGRSLFGNGEQVGKYQIYRTGISDRLVLPDGELGYVGFENDRQMFVTIDGKKFILDNHPLRFTDSK